MICEFIFKLHNIIVYFPASNSCSASAELEYDGGAETLAFGGWHYEPRYHHLTHKTTATNRFAQSIYASIHSVDASMQPTPLLFQN